MSTQQQHHDESPSHDRRLQLPALAPRDSGPSSSSSSFADRRPGSHSARSPRQSHRSRAGCWTCRGRKVKCDEVHPRCGPCTRLNRDCDWVHRWNFSDATSTTQGKHTNVNIAGNAVWDPNVRHGSSLSPSYSDEDDLEDPEFAILTADEDREVKAGTRRPGTYSVVLTPEAFRRSDIPEYASSEPAGLGRRTSSLPISRARRRLSSVRSWDHIAPNVVILDRFEDASPTTASGWTLPARRSSLPDLPNLSIGTPTIPAGFATTPQTPVVTSQSDYLLRHFQQYVVLRLVQPSHSGATSQSSIAAVLEREASRFRPLYHAICAISALNLACNRRSTLAEAMDHYGQALGAQTPASSPSDLASDGVFLRHFLLFVYDICITTNVDGGGDMWANHLEQLRRIAIQRNESGSMNATYAYALWSICELDLYAGLLGCGNCEFLQTIYNNNMLPPVEFQVPSVETLSSSALGPAAIPSFTLSEAQVFPAVLALKQTVMMETAKIATAARSFRSQAGLTEAVAPGLYAQWQALTSQLQNQLIAFWMQMYPHPQLGPPEQATTAGLNLPERVRCVFEDATLLYHAAILYSRTSMYPGQSRMPTANQQSILVDTEARVAAIFEIAVRHAAVPLHRHAVFPIFMAGMATGSGPNKSFAIDLIARFEDTGIGKNTARTKQLLVEVVNEQSRVASAGGKMEDVDWLHLARVKGLNVVNCGL